MTNEINSNCVENKFCLACDDKDLRTVLDLGQHPLANNYHTGAVQEEYPLKLNLCTKCFHLQLSHTVNPDLMFKNYLYVSGTSQTLKNYFDWFVNKTLEYNKNAKTILDIASNDGTQLDSFKKLGLETFGIDPAVNLYKTASDKGHSIVCDYFNLKTVKKFNDKKFDIITAQNVFAHTRYVKDFLKSCSHIMHDDSLLFIQTSQANMIINNEFDTIYHEHISFFNTNSMKILVESCGLHLSDAFKTDIHGISYVFVISKKQLNYPTVNDFLKDESQKNLYNVLTYPKYALNCYNITYQLKDKLIELKNNGYTLIGYGAAAKGNTLLNFGKIELDLIIDDNPLKQNLLTPGMNIPIVDSSVLQKYNDNDKIAFIPLAWNFYKEIREKIKGKRKNNIDLFVRYFPEILVER
jgi:2-polyprenyl-3-methyl-5-hydroxy-6-metoxy-1,4-benzoquinol methylase